MSELEDLVPEIRTWTTDGSPSNLSVEDWIAMSGSFRLAVGYSTVFWPRFRVVGDSVVRHTVGDEDYAVWLGQFEGDVVSTEAMVNHKHVVDLMLNDQNAATLESVLHLGSVIRDATAAKLALEFPDRRFVVTFDEPDPSDLVTAEITFWQDRSPQP